MRPRATVVKPLDNYRLLIRFSNNETRIFDVKPYFDFVPFRELQKPAMFNTVHVSGLSIVWQNGVDICPDELYYDSVPLHNADGKNLHE